MSDTKPSDGSPSIQDREVVFQMLDLGSNKEHQEELRRWVATGEDVISRSWTLLLNREAKNVARVRGYIEAQKSEALQSPVEVTDAEWQALRWAATRTVDGEPRLSQLNEILAKRNPAKMLEVAYTIVEQDMIKGGVSSIIHRTTPQRTHMNWSVRVFSELRTVELPSEESLYEVIHGALAQAYRIRNYDFSMSAEEREAQRRSFAYGNATLDNPRVTRELVDSVADQMKRG